MLEPYLCMREVWTKRAAIQRLLQEKCSFVRYHPKRIVYGHDENTIIILKLRFMMMNE